MNEVMKPVLILMIVVGLLCFEPEQTPARETPARAQQKQSGNNSQVALKTKEPKDKMIARLEAAIPRLMKDGEVPGLAIAVIGDARLAWQQAFGVKNVETKEPVTTDSVFEAASLSKPVFAYAVLKLVESGKLSLDTPLVKYFPEAYVENDERVNLITARRVLTHTTGFPNWRREKNLRIFFNPGDRFSYSGEGFVYLQKAVERVTGQPMNEVMTKLVFEPLGMTNSSYIWQERYASLKVTGHSGAGKPTGMRKGNEANAAGSLHTTASDYAKFVIAMINGTGLKRETLEEMLRPQVKVDQACSNCVDNTPSGKLASDIAWGIGWGLQQTEDGLSFWHWGENNGDVHCYVVAYPAQKLGVAIFTNSGSGHSIIPEIISEAIGGTHPAIAWIRYESYKSAFRVLFRDILARGEKALGEYKEKKKGGSLQDPLTERQVNRLGYWLIEKKRLAEALEAFKMNVEDYPDSWNAYDSLGEFYMIAGEKELAIKNYQKSVDLNPQNTGGINALKKLRGQ